MRHITTEDMEQPTIDSAPNNAQTNQQNPPNNAGRPSYTVSTPDGVEVDKPNVVEGTAMLITYSRTGFSPVSYKVTVKSIGSRLYVVNGDTIRVKSAEEAGITFTRKAGQDSSQPLNMVIVENKRAASADNRNVSPTHPTSSGSGDSNAWLKMLVCALAGLIVGFLLANLLHSGSDEEDDEETTVTTSSRMTKVENEDENDYEDKYENEDENDYENEAYLQQQQSFEQEDLMYLKQNDVWRMDELKSEKYKALFSAMTRGNITGLLDNDYSLLPRGDNNLNGYWYQIVSSLQKLQDEENYDALEECANTFMNMTQDGSCKLFDLTDAIKGIALPPAQRN